MCKFRFFQEELNRLREAGLLRHLRCAGLTSDTMIRMDGRELVNLSSNDYLNLAADVRVVKAACEAAGKWGFGASASRLICGTRGPHEDLEAEFAAFFGKEAALSFTSGWTANQAILTSLPQKGDLIAMDKADHASILDAAAASKADFRTYRRGDYVRLGKLLESTRYDRKFIVTESIFSMDGDCANLASLVELKKAYDAILVVDEAHSAGCMGRTGAGLAEDMGMLEHVDIVAAPLGKAFGAAGAVVATQKTVVDYLVNTARPFIYTTAPPPASCAAALAALEIVRSEPQRRRRLAENASYLRNRLMGQGLNIGNSSSHIIPVVTGKPQETVEAAEKLVQRGFLVVAIRPPTVPRGASRLRISVQNGHTVDQLDAFADALVEVLAG